MAFDGEPVAVRECDEVIPEAREVAQDARRERAAAAEAVAVRVREGVEDGEADLSEPGPITAARPGPLPTEGGAEASPW